MRRVESVSQVRGLSRAWKQEGLTVGFVPTMGALHEGHLSLIRLAKSHADRVVVSVFVNPTQFGPAEDFSRYPRDLEKDAALCLSTGADALWTPGVQDIYPEGSATFVHVEGPLASTLCGARRPGHFTGVATVVAKLFAAVEPDLAVFGQKDAQQVAVLRRMTRDLLLPVSIIVGPILREDDGLARSSRNAYLTPEERAQAVCLKQGLDAASQSFAQGERNPSLLTALCAARIATAPLARPDYVELVDGESLEPISETLSRPALLAVAAFFGQTRLIDNTVLTVRADPDIRRDRDGGQ